MCPETKRPAARITPNRGAPAGAALTAKTRMYSTGDADGI